MINNDVIDNLYKINYTLLFVMCIDVSSIEIHFRSCLCCFIFICPFNQKKKNLFQITIFVSVANGDIFENKIQSWTFSSIQFWSSNNLWSDKNQTAKRKTKECNPDDLWSKSFYVQIYKFYSIQKLSNREHRNISSYSIYQKKNAEMATLNSWAWIQQT